MGQELLLQVGMYAAYTDRMRTSRINVTLEDEATAALKSMAANQGVTMTEVIRQGLYLLKFAVEEGKPEWIEAAGIDFKAPEDAANARFWAKVDKTDGCWNWTGATDGKGHARFSYDGKAALARRHVLAITGEPAPEGMVTENTCRNTLCVRPDHIRVVTQKERSESRGPKLNSKSGVRGVSWHKPTRKWHAGVTHNGRFISVGYFDDAKEAEVAVIAKRNELFTHNDADRLHAIG